MASTTITSVDAYGGIPSAPAFVNHITVVPGTSAVTSGGFAVDLTTYIGAGRTVAFVLAQGAVTSTGALEPAVRWAYNSASGKLQAFSIGTTPAEITTGDYSATTVHLLVFSY